MLKIKSSTSKKHEVKRDLVKLEKAQAKQDQLNIKLEAKRKAKAKPILLAMPKVKARSANPLIELTTSTERLLMQENSFRKGLIVTLDNQEIQGYRKILFGFPSYYDDERNSIAIIKSFLPTEYLEHRDKDNQYYEQTNY